MSMSESNQRVPIFHYDPSAPAIDVDPYPTFTRLREGAPVHYWPEARAYVVSRFEDVAMVFRDPRFSPDPVAAGQPSLDDALPDAIRGPLEQNLLRLGPKDHARVRRAVSPAFTPRAVERLRVEVERLVDAGLAPLSGQSEIDVAPFADFIPLRVIASMLAIPLAHEVTFRRFGEALIRRADPRLDREAVAALAPVLAPGMDLIRRLVAERRQNLGDDLLSTLIRAEQAGDKLSEDEMLGLVSILITAGSETTVHFICFAVKSLLCVPERVAEVRADPGILRSALEEVLRFDGFGKMGAFRYALEDLEIGGVHLPRGTRVIGFSGAAQRDPRAYPNADHYDPRREPAEILTFGSGMHFCLGAALARLEGETAIRALLDRYTDFRLLGEPVYATHPVMRKIASLRIGVTPRGRAS
ncbi:putative cytochrome P450 hydroxylase [Minicystis rosea]|nr:putative cytochrome P450 hydroxylase [Minicystis rosea]